MMNYFNKIKMFVFCLFLVLCWSGYGLSPAFASKEKKISAKTGKVAVVKGSMAEKVAKPHAFFDTDKMSDMSDFDPASWVSPTGDTIKIGVITCFSGPGAFNGQIAWSVVTWVAHDINKRGGIWVDGKKKLIEIVRGDHMSKPDQCKKISERLALQDKVHIIWGTAGSNMMKIMNETARKYKIISHCVSNLADELQDATNFSRYAFMSSCGTDQVGRGLAYYYGQIRKKEKKFYIICQDYSYGHDVGEGFKKGLKEYYPEAQVVGEDYHKLFLTDFAPYLTKIRASGAEVICTGNWPPDGGNLLKQARQMGIDLPFAHVLMNDPNMLHDVGLEGTKGLVHIDEFNTPPPAFKSPGHIKYYRAWNSQWKKWKTPPYNSHFFEHGDYIQKYIMQTYWLMSVLERAKSTDPEKIIKVWEGDTFQYVNGKIMMMRACDHRAIQDFTVSEYVGPEEQKQSFNIPPFYWYKGSAAPGPGALVPAAKVFPPIDPKEERCKGKNGWGE
jgi:ABC-type branched-subunit amino acid transport system substrate-binding protein